MRLKIVSDGTVFGTHVLDKDTGEELGGVTAISFEGTGLGLQVHLALLGVELEFDGEFKAKAPIPPERQLRVVVDQRVDQPHHYLVYDGGVIGRVCAQALLDAVPGAVIEHGTPADEALAPRIARKLMPVAKPGEPRILVQQLPDRENHFVVNAVGAAGVVIANALEQIPGSLVELIAEYRRCD